MNCTFESRRVRKATRKIRSRWTPEEYRNRSGAAGRLPHTWNNVLLVSLERISLYDERENGDHLVNRAVEFGNEAMETTDEGKPFRGT